MYDDKVKNLVLMKLLSFVKFKCKDSEALEYSLSPIVSEILDECLSNFYDNTDYKNENNSNFIIDGIENNIKKIDNWDRLDFVQKRELLVDLMSPYKLKENIIIKLLNNKY